MTFFRLQFTKKCSHAFLFFSLKVIYKIDKHMCQRTLFVPSIKLNIAVLTHGSCSLGLR